MSAAVFTFFYEASGFSDFASPTLLLKASISVGMTCVEFFLWGCLFSDFAGSLVCGV